MPICPRYPNLFLAGAPRAGTTFLFDLLSQSSDVFAAKDKEPSFFYFQGLPWVVHNGRKLRNRRESWSESSYLNLYDDWGDEVRAVDGSTYYLLDPVCAERIHAKSPDAKIILVLREPIARAYSHYLMEKRDGWVTEDFTQALVKELGEMETPEKPYAGHYHFIRGSRYVAGVQAFLDRFGPANVCVVQFVDLVADSQRCLDALCDFAGIARFVPAESARKNESGVLINPAAARLASRYRYSAARSLISKAVPRLARDKVRELLLASRPSNAPAAPLSDDDRKTLEHYLASEFSAALQISRDAGILLEFPDSGETPHKTKPDIIRFQHDNSVQH